ncbi:unnamed protein product, partial [Nesidiocoris tenuis]
MDWKYLKTSSRTCPLNLSLSGLKKCRNYPGAELRPSGSDVKIKQKTEALEEIRENFQRFQVFLCLRSCSSM